MEKKFDIVGIKIWSQGRVSTYTMHPEVPESFLLTQLALALHHLNDHAELLEAIANMRTLLGMSDIDAQPPTKAGECIHEADIGSIVGQSDSTIVDVWCSECGVSGSLHIDTDDIQW